MDCEKEGLTKMSFWRAYEIMRELGYSHEEAYNTQLKETERLANDVTEFEV